MSPIRFFLALSCCLISPILGAQAKSNSDGHTENKDDTSTNTVSESSTALRPIPALPRLEFESTRYNFGNIYRGSIVTHTFAFKNTGDSKLILTSLHPSCGCLNTKIYGEDGFTPKTQFAPDENGFVHVDFDSSLFSGDIVRTVTVETNMGSSRPTVTLTLTAKVLQELYASPALVHIGKIDKGIERSFSTLVHLDKRAKIEIPDLLPTLQNTVEKMTNSAIARTWKDSLLNNTAPLQIFGVESSLPELDAQMTPTSSPSDFRITIRTGQRLPIGPVNARLTVWNNSTFYKDLQIPIVGEIVGRVNSSAKYVEFGVINPSQSVERLITYTSSLKNFAITSVHIHLKRLGALNNLTDADLFSIRKEKIAPPGLDDEGAVRAYRLRFKLFFPKALPENDPAKNNAGTNVSGYFVVNTNDPDYKEIRVPFFGILRKD